jgi:hypothetical protein
MKHQLRTTTEMQNKTTDESLVSFGTVFLKLRVFVANILINIIVACITRFRLATATVRILLLFIQRLGATKYKKRSPRESKI